MPKYNGPWIYEVKGSLPAKEGQNWRRNVSAHVVTFDVGKAIALFHHTFGWNEVRIHSVEQRNAAAHLIMDPTVLTREANDGTDASPEGSTEPTE